MSIRIPRPSFKLPQRNKPVDPQQDDAWRSKPYRWGLWHVRRGRDKQWHFPGQEADETVRMVVRKHWSLLVKPALPIIGLIVLLFGILPAIAFLPQFHLLWMVIEVVFFILLLVLFIRFVNKDFLVWWLDVSIITNKRIITWHGFLHPTRQETPIEKVQQIVVDQDSIFEKLLSYGSVHLYLAGGQIVMEYVANPRAARDAIYGITSEIQKKKAQKEKPPLPTDPALADVLKTLGKTKDVPKLPDPDAKYPPRNEDGFLGPRRTFGGPLRIPCEVRYSWGEATVMYLQRSRYILVPRLALPVFILLALLPVAFIGGPLLRLIIAMVTLALLVIIGLIIIAYWDDIYILTTRRIIDIERKLIIFYEARAETEYKNIKDVRVEVPTVIHLMLNIGHLYIETPGSSPDIILRNISHPFFIQDKISFLKGYKEEADKIKAANERKEELTDWFSKVVTTLEKKVQSAGAPDLQNLDFWSAAQRAGEFRLRVVVIGEATMNSSQPPGQVVQQIPLPGTLMVPGSEIQVVLSKRPRSTTVLLEH
jgi:Bacterial PH domain/PASTA domain